MNLISVKKLNTSIEKVLNKKMSDLLLTSTQTDILCYLYMNKNKIVCQKDIENALSLSRPTVSSVLKRLLEKKMICITFFNDDRRYKHILLTSKSEEIMQQVFERVDEVYIKATKGFSEEEIEQFFEYLQKMNNNLI